MHILRQSKIVLHSWQLSERVNLPPFGSTGNFTTKTKRETKQCNRNERPCGFSQNFKRKCQEHRVHILKEKFSSAIDKPDTLIFIKEGFTPPISIKRNQQQTTRTSYLTKIKPKATYYRSLCLDLMTTLLMDPYNLVHLHSVTTTKS